MPFLAYLLRLSCMLLSVDLDAVKLKKARRVVLESGVLLTLRSGVQLVTAADVGVVGISVKLTRLTVLYHFGSIIEFVERFLQAMFV